jgi:transposase
MDVLSGMGVADRLQETVFFSVANLLNLEVDVILFDTTSTSWERDQAEPGGGLRWYGHSKDHRDDLPQIVIGLAVTKEGIPMRCWVWPGNTTDMSVAEEVWDGMRAWRLGRVVTVTDRGFSSQKNLDHLRQGGGHDIGLTPEQAHTLVTRHLDPPDPDSDPTAKTTNKHN